VIVADCSIAIKWIFPEEHSELALALLHEATARGERVVAPPLLLMEFTNAVRQRVRSEGLSHAAAMQAITALLNLPLDIVSLVRETLLEQQIAALAIADRYDLPATYDAQYLALAEQLECEFWTADVRLLRRVGAGSSLIRAIGDYRQQ
jgi:predicted nucleic acid-binding protein